MENLENDDKTEFNYIVDESEITIEELVEESEQFPEEDDDEDNILLKAKHLFKELIKPVSLTNIEKQINDEEQRIERERARKKEAELKRKQEELAEIVTTKATEAETVSEIVDIESIKEKEEMSNEIFEEDEVEKEEFIDFDSTSGGPTVSPPQPQEPDAFFDTDIFAEIIAEQEHIVSFNEEIKEIEFSPLEIIEKIIQSTVQQAEGEAKRAFLISKIDRDHLVNRFMQIHKQIINEQNKNQLLNRVTFDHFRRKKHARAIIPDIPSKLQLNIEKYRKNLLNLDDILNRQEKFAKEKSENIAKLLSAKKKIEEEIQEDTIKLKKTILEGGQMCYNDQTGKYLTDDFILANISKLFDTWEKVNDVRLDTIYAEYRTTEYEKQVAALENIGEGLRITTYEVLRAEAETAEKAVQDRCTDILRSKSQYNTLTELIGHIREKIDILQIEIGEKVIKFNEAKLKNKLIRERLITLQSERNNLRKKYNKLVWEAGLKDKPTLLHDYDDTVKQIEETETNVKSLEMKKKMIENEIDRLTKKYNVK